MDQLIKYLEKALKNELKWMHHYDIDDDMFGVETDKYIWCKRVIEGDTTVERLVEYFQENYCLDEKSFIADIIQLIESKEVG